MDTQISHECTSWISPFASSSCCGMLDKHMKLCLRRLCFCICLSVKWGWVSQHAMDQSQVT